MILSPIENLWRHWWAGHMEAVGGSSLLERHPVDPILLCLSPPPLPRASSPPRAKTVKSVRRPARPRVSRPRTEAEHTERAQRTNRKILPLSEWAQSLFGDDRITHISLADILDGIDSYFALFTKLKRVDPETYDYFRRVGMPVVFRNTNIYKRSMDMKFIPHPDALPSMFGCFFARTAEEYREEIIADTGLLAVTMFHSRNNFRTVAPLGTRIFAHNQISLDHSAAFSRKEQRKYPYVRGNWGCGWFLGVLPDGSIRALPSYMSRAQRLPNGEVVRHSSFQIPPGVQELAKNADSPHDWVRGMFMMAVAFTASALAGVQVTIKKGGVVARFGVPITSLKEFFYDRETHGQRRRALLHLGRPHERVLRDGKVIIVGEHLRGTRNFEWRGYHINVSIPGVHHPAVEGFAADFIGWPEGEATPEGMADIRELGQVMSTEVWRERFNPFRKGKPTSQYTPTGLPEGSAK